MKGLINMRIDHQKADSILEDLRSLQNKLYDIDGSTLIGLDLADLAEEVRHAIRVLQDRSNLS